MFRLSLFVLAAFALTVVAPARAQEPARIDEYLAEWQTTQAPGLAVSISRDGTTIYQGSFGLAHLEHGIPVTPDSRFHIASVSKQFTAFAIMLLEAEGELTLADDIRLHLPGLAATDVPVTINHLLSHTGGLREENTLAAMMGRTEHDAELSAPTFALLKRQVGVNFPAGAEREYSNTGYFLLAMIVERVSGQSFAEFAKERIFAPLGMDDTVVRGELDTPIPHRALSYFPHGESFTNASLQSAAIGSTGIVTTAGDMLRWARNFESRQVGPDRAFEMMKVQTYLPDGRLAIGANGQELRVYKGFETWSHGGRTGAYRSFLLRIPALRVSIVILGNRADIDSAKIAFGLADIMLAGEPEALDEPEQPFDPESGTELDKYLGDYQLFAGTIFSVTRTGDMLHFAELGSQEKSPVEQIGRGRFLLDPRTNISLDFVEFADGKAKEMRYQIGLHGFIPALRITLAPFDRDSFDPDDYAGSYYSPELQVGYVFSVGDGSLVMADPMGKSVPLAAYQEHMFSPAGQSAIGRVIFQTDESGKVTGAKISGALANDVHFQRIRLP